MLYRHPDGSYRASSPDGEWSKDMTKEEGEEIIRRFRDRDPVLIDKILSETTPGFVII
jgi:hypothetical protein